MAGLSAEIFDLPARQLRLFWGASGNLWQTLWDRFLDVTGYGIDSADTPAAINLLTKLKIATVEETEDQITIVYQLKPSVTESVAEEKIFDTVVGNNNNNNTSQISIAAIPADSDAKVTESTILTSNLSNRLVSENNSKIYEVNEGDEKNNSDDDELLDFSPDVLRQLLNATVIGKNIIQQSEKGVLSERRQLELAEVVATWHLAHRTKLHERDLQKYSRVIVLLFKNEKQDSYFLSRGGDKRNPGGKIANKVNTLKNRARKRKLHDEEHNTLLNNNSTARKERSEDHSIYERDALDWLIANTAPWTTVLDKWKSSFQNRTKVFGRLNVVDELIKLKLWNLITSEFGHQLIDIDFQLLNLGSPKKNIGCIEVCRVIGRYIRSRSTDETTEHLIDVLISDSTTDGDDPFRLWIFGTLIYTMLLYWTIGSVYTLFDVTNQPRFMRRYKVQPGTNEPVDNERLRRVIRQVLFNQVVTGLPMLLILYSLIEPQTRESIRQLPTFPTVVWQIIVCIVIEEFGFYYSHRLLHDGRIYKYIHKQHHEWTAPIAITAMYSHPVENLLSNLLPIGVGVWATGCHIAVAWLWFTLAISNTLHVHSGYHLPFLPSPEQHDFHHLKFNQCYGVLGVLDWLHGTNSLFMNSKQSERDYILTKFVPVREIHPDSQDQSRPKTK